MRYGPFLKKGKTIGLIAPSFGVRFDPYLTKLNYAVTAFIKRGYQIQKSDSVHLFDHARSNTAEQRAKEFQQMWNDPQIDFISSVAGGEVMYEILPYLDFNQLRQSPPKFFMGYSDNTILTFLLTTLCDVATIYGTTFTGFGMKIWDPALQEAYQIMSGQLLTQKSYDRYQILDTTMEEGHFLDPYNKTEPVSYQTINDQEVHLRGRLIGGCLDILTLFCGTPYDQVRDFLQRYQTDGIIWYLEACDLHPLALTRSLLQLKMCGWFDGCQGIVFGRPFHDKEVLFDVGFHEAIISSLSDLNIPVVMDMDFGHLPPSFTIINGSIATIDVHDHQGQITYELL